MSKEVRLTTKEWIGINPTAFSSNRLIYSQQESFVLPRNGYFLFLSAKNLASQSCFHNRVNIYTLCHNQVPSLKRWEHCEDEVEQVGFLFAQL